jgi:hypothetical protein
MCISPRIDKSPRSTLCYACRFHPLTVAGRFPSFLNRKVVGLFSIISCKKFSGRSDARHGYSVDVLPTCL